MVKKKEDSFYDSNVRYDNLMEGMAQVYLDNWGFDDDTYGNKPIQTGMTVRFADKRDDNLYHVLINRRNRGYIGKGSDENVLITDSNNQTQWVREEDIEMDFDVAAMEPQAYDPDREMFGGPSESFELEYNMKKASTEYFDEGKPVFIRHMELEGVVLGRAGNEISVAYYDPFGQPHYGWFKEADLTPGTGVIAQPGKVADEINAPLQKLSSVDRSDIHYEAELMRMEGCGEDQIMEEMTKAFGADALSVLEALSQEE